MSGFTVKRDSWHYKWLSLYSVARDIWSDEPYFDEDGKADVVQKYSSEYFRRPRDFCSYWRRVIVWPALRIFVSNIPVFLLIFMIATTGIQYTGIGIGMILLTFLGIAAIAGVCYLIFAGIRKGTGAVVSSVAETELVEAAYRSYKDNICLILDYEDKK